MKMRAVWLWLAMLLPVAAWAQIPGPPFPADISGSTVTPTGGTATIQMRVLAADVADVRGFSGIDCTGATTSTGFQAAITASTGMWLLIPANCTILADHIALSSANYIKGEGPTSIIKHIANAVDHLFSESNTGATVIFKDLTLDGNYQNNGGDDNQTKGTFRMYAGGLSATQPSTVVIDNVTFLNGGTFDTSTHYAATPYYTNWFETNTRHFGGADGYSAGIFDGNSNFFLSNIQIDPQRLPTSSSAVGRSGYIMAEYAAGQTNLHTVRATNFHCRNTGVSAAAGVLGCLDFYSGVSTGLMTNVSSDNAIGRGFSWKADAQNIEVHGGIVTNLAGNAANSSANVVDGAFGMNSGVETFTGKNLVLDDIICSGITNGSSAHAACIFYTAANVLNNPTSLQINARISNFFVDGCGAGVYAINITDPVNVTVSDGTIKDCASSIVVTTDGVMATGPLWIDHVKMVNSGKPSLTTGLTASPFPLTGLWYVPDVQSTPFTLSDLALTVATNAVTAWTPVVVVNTGSGAQSVSTISGVPDGQAITVFASSTNYALTLATGGNLGLAAAGSFVTSAANDNMSMRALTIGTPTLIETGRSH